MIARHLRIVVAAVLLALLLPACGTPVASPSPTDRGDTASCGDSTVGTASPAPTDPTTTQTPESTTSAPPDAEYSQKHIPEGSWDGPIVISATGTSVLASGTVFNGGGGSVHLVIHSHHVQSGTATFTATSSGTVTTASGGTGTISGSASMTDGVVTGTDDSVKITGTWVQNGSIAVTVHGIQSTVPLTGSTPITATLTVTSVSCTQVVATFIPDLNSKTGGRAAFSGTAEWRGDRV